MGEALGDGAGGFVFPSLGRYPPAMTGRLTEGIESLLDWGIAKASSISASVKDVLVTVLGDDGDEIEEVVEQVLSVDAAVLVRPAAPTNDGAMEVLFVRRGEERTTIATRDPRWQVDLEEGEVVVRAFASGAALVRIRPDGTIVLAGDVAMGADTATEAVVLGTTLKSYLDANKTWQDTHTHPFVATGAVSPTAVPTAPSPTVPAIESTRHTVDS